MPSPNTAGALAEKIVELKSRITVQEKLKEILLQNYMPSDSGLGEQTMFREDGAPIGRNHLSIAIDDIDERIETLRMELHDFEEMPIAERKVVEAPKLVAQQEPAPGKEKRSGNPKRIGQSPPATR
jgi:hypothetical protein